MGKGKKASTSKDHEVSATTLEAQNKIMRLFIFTLSEKLDFDVWMDTKAKANRGGIWQKVTRIASRVGFLQ